VSLDKAPEAFRTISEVAEELNVPQHVLRFWESRFHEIKPMKRGGGRRYYRPQDIDLLRGIRHLLYGEGYTVRGVQRLLREQGHRFVQNVWQAGAPQTSQGVAADHSNAGEIEERVSASTAPPEVSFRSQTPGASPRSERASALSAEQRSRLQEAMRELSECQRLLAAAREGS